jgi:hypothetical protein
MVAEEFLTDHVGGERHLKRVQGILLVTAFGGAVLGFAGFYVSLSAVAPPSRFVLAAVGTFQLFILGVDFSKLDNWSLQVASLIAPSATATALWVVFATKLADWWFRRQNLRKPPYAVVLGGGHLSPVIVNHLLRSRVAGSGRIIVLDRHGQLDLLSREAFPARVIRRLGDALDPLEISAVGACRASKVWIVTGDDRRNIDILQLLHRQFDETESHVADRQWFIDVNKRELLQHAADLEYKWRQKNLLSGVDTIQFNLERMVAREIFKFCFCGVEGPADQVWRAHHQRSNFHVAVVGASDLSEEVVLHAVQYLVVNEQPESAPMITWFGSCVQARRARLLESFPVLDPTPPSIPSLQAVLPLAQLNAIDVDEFRLSAEKWTQSQKDRSFDLIVFVAAEGGAQDLVLRQVLAQELCARTCLSDFPTPIVIVSPPSAKPGSASLLIDSLALGSSTGSAIYAFDSARIWKSDEDYPGAECDLAAKQLNFHFKRHQVCQGETPESKWREAKEFERWSSRYAADHFEIQRRLETLLPRNIDHAEALARIEHRRYVVERLMDGWLPLWSNNSGGKNRDIDTLKKLRVHPDLVPWDELSEDSTSKKRTVELVKKMILRGDVN